MTTTTTVSDVIADRIRLFRARAGMNREQLAAACTALGMDGTSASVVANIETGRRGPDGKRRRDITVDELLTLARALGVPPLMLIFGVENDAYTPVLPGRELPAWAAALWFTGAGPLPGAPGPAGRGLRMNTAEDVETEPGRVPLALRWEHRDHNRDWNQATLAASTYRRQADQAATEAERTRLLGWADHEEDRIQQIEAELRALRREMARHGVEPPELNTTLAHLNDAH